jgi:hypothetical protein
MHDFWFLSCVFGLVFMAAAVVIGAIADFFSWRAELNREAWWRHVTGLCVVLFATATVTAAGEPAWRNVDATAMPENVRQCIYIKQVSASGAMAPKDVRVTEAMPSATKMATALALKRLKIQTTKAGGDLVLVTAIVARDGRAEMRGEVYRCGGKR